MVISVEAMPSAAIDFGSNEIFRGKFTSFSIMGGVASGEDNRGMAHSLSWTVVEET